jgi:hypothetical protein
MRQRDEKEKKIEDEWEAIRMVRIDASTGKYGSMMPRDN